MFKRKRTPPLTKLRWLTLEQSRGERFADAMKTASGQKIFDLDFIKGVADRKQGLEKIFWKLAIFNSLLVGVLFLNSSIIKVEFAFSGVTARDVGRIKEILLFVSATISVFSNIAFAEVSALENLIKTWLRRNYPDSVSGFLLMRFGNFSGSIPPIVRPSQPHQYETGALIIGVVIFAISVILFAFSFIAFTIGAYVVVIIDIIKSPSLPWLWSWFVVGYVVIVNIIALCLLGFRWIPLPYRDYSFVNELSELSKKSPGEYEAKLKEFIARGRGG